MSPDRMLEKNHPPTQEEVLTFIGPTAGQFWAALHRFVVETYDLQPEWKYEGSKSGWSMYCRKSGRALLNMSPDSEGFTALVVLGAKEAEKALSEAGSLGANVRELLETAHVFHDGRWLWIRVKEKQDVEDIQKLLILKKNPPRKKNI